MKKIIASVVAAFTLLSLTACKEIDRKAVNAELVEGTNNLYRYCDGIGTLIYFEDNSGGDDQYEAMFFGACENGKAKENFQNPNANNGGANN